MKRQIQERLMKDYEANKESFGSFTAFIAARAGKSEAVQSIRKKLGLSN
jgi:hydroxymethylpyrimidine pyrophosphatase-like HAD family hydrolase